MKQQTGATLIEILVTLLIISVGMLGLSGLQANAIKANLDAAQQSQVMWIAQEIAERMHTNPQGASFYQIAAQNIAAAAPPCGVPAPLCADSPDGAGTTCTQAERANYDVAEVYCGHNVNNVFTDSSDTVSLASMTITPTVLTLTVGGTPQTYYTVTVNWVSKLVTDIRDKSTTDDGNNLYADRYTGGQEIQSTTYRFIP